MSLHASRHRIHSVLPIAPILIYTIVLYVSPLAWLFYISLHKYQAGAFYGIAWTPDNYAKVLLDSYYLAALLQTIKIGVTATAITLVLGYGLAYFLATTRSALWRRIGPILVIIPLWMSSVVKMFGWLVLLGETGPITLLLKHLGLQTASLLYNEVAVIIGLVHWELPFMVLALLPVLESIGRELKEAAHALGANSLMTFRYVTLPLSLPGILAGSALVFGAATSAFITPLLLGGGKVPMVSLLIRQQATYVYNWPFAGALAVSLLTITLGVMMAASRTHTRLRR